MDSNEKQTRRLMGKITDDMRGLLNVAGRETRVLNQDEQHDVDKLMEQVDQLATKVGDELPKVEGRAERLAAIEHHLIKVVNPTQTHNFRGNDDGITTVHEPWVNQETGEAIKVLTREERMADLVVSPGYEPLSIGKYIRGLATGEWKGAAAEHRAMSEGSIGAGLALVPSPLAANIIDRARNASVLFQAGALTIPMDSQTLSIARVSGDPTAAWKTEAAVITPSDLTFEKVTFTAQVLAAICQVSVELIEDASNVDQVVSETLARVLALELDRAGLRGSGTPPELKGIRYQTGVNIDTTTFTTNGSVISASAPAGAPAHIWLAKMIAAMWAVNEAPNAVIWAPRTAGEMDQLVDSTGQPLRELPSESKLTKLQTASVPITLTQGTSNDCSEATLGDFSKAMVGMRTSLTLEVSRIGNVGSTSMFTTMQVGIRAYLRADFQVARPAAFRVVCGIR